jgi:hypothetical protein
MYKFTRLLDLKKDLYTKKFRTMIEDLIKSIHLFVVHPTKQQVLLKDKLIMIAQ